MADFEAQLNRPFEHEARMKDLVAKQAQLNAAVDLDKSEKPVVAESPEAPSGIVGRIKAVELNKPG